MYLIGFGTANPTSMVCTAAQLGGRGFEGRGGIAGGGAVGGRNYLVADEATLQQVADVTGGEYFAAADADRLQRVLEDLPRTVQTQHREVEVSVSLSQPRGAAAARERMGRGALDGVPGLTPPQRQEPAPTRGTGSCFVPVKELDQTARTPGPAAPSGPGRSRTPRAVPRPGTEAVPWISE